VSRAFASWATIAVLSIGGLSLLSTMGPAQEGKAPTATAPDTAEEKIEREVRRKCAVALCSTLHNKKPAEGQVTCNLHKTWRKEVLSKILARGKISWPWGDTRCTSELKFDRAMLVKAMQENDFEAQFDSYDIRCQIDADKDRYNVTTQVRPKVTFKQGKAVKANLNWGKIEAPSLAKSALWSITAVDNTFGVLQSLAVEDINGFIATKCMEYKDEWQGK
jgi:hypothetical protein